LNSRFEEILKEGLRNRLAVKAQFGRIGRVNLLSVTFCGCNYHLSTLSKLVTFSGMNSEERSQFLAVF